MYNITNLTHRSISLNDETSVAPKSSVNFNSAITSQISRLKQMGLITITEAQPVVKASSDKADRTQLRREFEERVARARAEKQSKSATKKKSTSSN